MSLNPVERRLLELKAHWEAFLLNRDKKVLIWQCPSSAYRLVDCFFEAQKHELDYSTNDVFVVFKIPFKSSVQYSRELKQALGGMYQASRAEFAANGLEPDWTFEPSQFPDTPAGFVQALSSFGAQYDAAMNTFVAALMPTSALRGESFKDWVMAAAACLPARLRIVVADPVEAPCFANLAKEEEACALRQLLTLDILMVAQETFAQEPTNGPAGTFRNLLMALVSLVEKGSPREVDVKARDALHFAEKQGWTDQQIVVLFLLAGARLKEQRVDEAVDLYRLANTAAKKATEEGHPAGIKLQLQALFGEAGAQLAAGRMQEAAICYDTATHLARADNDAVLFIEASRMGGFCHARMADSEGAISRLNSALDAGERLPAVVRRQTTLAIAAEDLLRLLDLARCDAIKKAEGSAQANVEAALAYVDKASSQSSFSFDPKTLQPLTQHCEAQCTAAWASAERQLQTIVASADPRFRACFGRARAMLGLAWPCASAEDYLPTDQAAAS